MLSSLTLSTIDRLETQTGEKADYLRDVVHQSPLAFAKFLLAMPMANHCRTLRDPQGRAAWHLARLIATRHEDCGPCVQIVVDMALAEGVDAGLLHQALGGSFESLPEPLHEVCALAKAVVTSAPDAAFHADRVAERFGRGALVDLGFAIIGGRLFPTLKRTLGHARSCSTVRIEDTEIRVDG